jgi:hypothetical protein
MFVTGVPTGCGAKNSAPKPGSDKIDKPLTKIWITEPLESG